MWRARAAEWGATAQQRRKLKTPNALLTVERSVSSAVVASSASDSRVSVLAIDPSIDGTTTSSTLASTLSIWRAGEKEKKEKRRKAA